MFMDVILDNHIQTQRLDTLEEVSEPASSEYWQLDSIGSKDSATNVTTITTAGKYSRNIGSFPTYDHLDTALADTLILWNFIIEKTSLSGVSFREEMFSTSEIDVVETTIALTSSSSSQAALNEVSKIHGKMIMISDCIMRISYNFVNLK